VPIRRGSFNKLVDWRRAVAFIGVPGLHFHDYADLFVMPTSVRNPWQRGVTAALGSA